MPTWSPSHRAPRTARPLTWPNQRDWSKDTSYHTADLAQVRSATPTCRCTPHHQYGRRGGKCDNTLPYGRPGTGKVGNPHLQAHASPPFKAYKHEGGVVINPGSATGVHSSITYDANPSFVLLDIGLLDQLHRGMEGTGKPRSDSCVSDDRKLPRVWVPQMKTTALGPVRSRISYADWDREQGNEVPTKRLLHRARIGCVG
ncbi:hypothetical protein BHE74_00010370 [Ensete ventricosum]|nr:hypothetical protein BHE74_00010370 [Ensete ventricosum]